MVGDASQSIMKSSVVEGFVPDISLKACGAYSESVHETKNLPVPAGWILTRWSVTLQMLQFADLSMSVSRRAVFSALLSS